MKSLLLVPLLLVPQARAQSCEPALANLEREVVCREKAGSAALFQGLFLESGCGRKAGQVTHPVLERVPVCEEIYRFLRMAQDELTRHGCL